MIELSTLPKLIQFTDFICGIQYCVTVVGKCIFGINISFVVPLNCDNLSFCCTNDDETKVMDVYKGVLKSINFFKQIKVSSLFRSKKT